MTNPTPISIFCFDYPAPLAMGSKFFPFPSGLALAVRFASCCNPPRETVSFSAPFAMPDEDTEISMDDLRNHRQRAWDRAYPLLHRSMLKALEGKCSPRIGLDPENTASDIMANEILPNFRDQCGAFWDASDFQHLRNLAARTARFRAVDAIRRANRRQETELPENWEDFLGTQEKSSDQPGSLEQFMAIVSVLPPPKPEVLEDIFVGDLSYKEVAAKRGLEIGTVGSHLSRGIAMLRKLLSQDSLPPFSHE